VVMPMLNGFYMGEISATFRLLAEQKGVNLIIIRSGDSRDFSLPIALHQVDALVVVLHAAANTYVEAATQLDIPVISMGASYSPLPVARCPLNSFPVYKVVVLSSYISGWFH